jgi:5,10-methylenetetrahydromethanopterin reductase
MSRFDFGVGLFPTEPLQKMIHLAKVSEEVGFSHIWVGDSHLIWREAYINMTAMMLNTSKVKFGTGVTNPLTRHPSVVASGYATLEEYAPGRMIVGIGLGDSSVETMGMKPSTLANFESSLAQMRALFAGKEAELPSGKIHLLHPCKNKVPIYVAASGPKMLELSGRIADGIIVLVGVADEYIAHAKEKIAAGARAAGRKLEDINLVLWVPCAVSETANAKDAVKAHVARVVAHPLPYVLDPNELLPPHGPAGESRRSDPGLAGRQVRHRRYGGPMPHADRAHQENRHSADRDHPLQPTGRQPGRDDSRVCERDELTTKLLTMQK